MERQGGTKRDREKDRERRPKGKIQGTRLLGWVICCGSISCAPWRQPPLCPLLPCRFATLPLWINVAHCYHHLCLIAQTIFLLSDAPPNIWGCMCLSICLSFHVLFSYLIWIQWKEKRGEISCFVHTKIPTPSKNLTHRWTHSGSRFPPRKSRNVSQESTMKGLGKPLCPLHLHPLPPSPKPLAHAPCDLILKYMTSRLLWIYYNSFKQRW